MRKHLAAALVAVLLAGSGGAWAKDKDGDPPGNSDHARTGSDGPGNSNNGNDNNGKHNGSDGETPGATNAAPSVTSGTASTGSNQIPANGQGQKSEALDQDMALQAVEDRRALPLEVITAAVEKSSNGEIIDARLVTVGGFLLYELKVLEGDRLDLQYYYARSGIRVRD